MSSSICVHSLRSFPLKSSVTLAENSSTSLGLATTIRCQRFDPRSKTSISTPGHTKQEPLTIFDNVLYCSMSNAL